MALKKEEKQKIIDDIATKISDTKSIIFVKHDGLKVSESQQVRTECRKENIECTAIKKTLLQLALNKVGIGENFDVKSFDGSVMLVSSKDDEVLPAKIIKDQAKEFKKLSFLGGYMFSDNKALSIEEVTALANIPSKLELYAKLVGSINSPISGFVNVLAGNLRGLVNILNAVKDQKES